MNTNVYQIEELQSFQIISDLNYTFIGKVTIRISTSNGSEVAVCESEPIQVLTGLQLYNNVSFRYVGRTQLFSGNSLIVQYHLQEISTGIILSMNTESIRIIGEVDTGTIEQKKLSKITKFINVSGNIDLNGQYNNRDDTTFYLPTNFFRADIKNDIEVLKVPLNTRFYITTEQMRSEQKLNIYHVGFDVNKFKQNMLSTAKDKLEKIVQQGDSSKNNFLLRLLEPDLAAKNVSAYKDNLSSKYRSEAGNITEKYQQQLGAIDTLKQLFQTYDDASISKILVALKEISEGVDDSLRHLAENSLDSIENSMDSAKVMKLKKLKKLIDDHNIENSTQVMSQVNKIQNYSIQDLSRLTDLKQHISANALDIEKKVNVDLQRLMIKPDVNSLLGKEDILAKIDDKFSILSKKDKILNSIKGFDIGYATPVVGRNTQNGVAINGYNLEFNYKKFIISSNGGKLLNNIPVNSFSFRSFKQFLFSNSVGYGNKSSNYILLTHTFGKLNQSDSVAESRYHLVSMNYRVAFFKMKLMVNGEIPFSLRRSNETVKYGFAPSIHANYKITKSTNIDALYEYISIDYTSYGVPFIINNYHHGDIHLDQTIRQRFVIGAGYTYKRFRDTVNSNSIIVLHSLPVNINARFTNEFSVSAVFAANWLLEKRLTNNIQDNFFYSVNAAVNYNKHFKKIGYNMQTAVLNSYFYNNNRVMNESGSIILVTNIRSLLKNISCYSLHSIQINKNINTTFTINYTFYNGFLQSNNNFIIFMSQYQHSIGKKITLMLNNNLNRNLRTSIRNSTSVNVTYRINRYFMCLLKFQYDKFKGFDQGEWGNKNGYLMNTGIRISY